MDTRRGKPRGIARRPGVIIVVVLVVVALLTLAAYTFAELMLTHYRAAKLSGRQLQTRAFVESGADAIRFYLMQDGTAREEAGGHFNNPAYFRAVPVLMNDDPAEQGNFTVLVPNIDDDGHLNGLRYGLEDESARLNVNALTEIDKLPSMDARDLLMGLPGMTEDVADAILDWIDEDEDAREYGCESEYYQGLDPPYCAKNGPLDTLEELMLVRGVTPELLYGTDTNRNGMVDSHEAGQMAIASEKWTTGGSSSVASSQGSLDRGWLGYLTLHSQEKNVRPSGESRIDLNMDDMEGLYEGLSTALSEEWATFIVLYRQYGPYSGDAEGEPVEAVEMDFTREATTHITQVLDLVGKKVRVPGEGTGEGDGNGNRNGDGTVVATVFPETSAELAVYMPLLMDATTTLGEPVIPGRINVNLAPRPLLLGIPQLEEATVDQIIGQRMIEPANEDEGAARRHATWLLTSGLVTLEQMRTLTPIMCAGGDVFRGQIIGYYQDGTAASRSEMIIDATGAVPRIVSSKIITHLGRGYPLELLGAGTIAVGGGIVPDS